jgi:hypothetical protein
MYIFEDISSMLGWGGRDKKSATAFFKPLDCPKGVNKCSNKPNGFIFAVFWMSSAATGIW